MALVTSATYKPRTTPYSADELAQRARYSYDTMLEDMSTNGSGIAPPSFDEYMRSLSGVADKYPASMGNGPDIGKLWPGYWQVNPNVEAQYATWREARRANGEDPYDMEAFRAYLKSVGAPDPGLAGTTSGAPAPTSTPTITPAAPKTGVGALRPLPEIHRTGPVSEMFRAGLGVPSDTAQDDYSWYFPYQTDPGFAAGNLLTQFGINTSVRNPLIGHLLQQAATIPQLEILSQLAAGNNPNVRDVTNAAANSLSMGGGLANPGDLISKLAALTNGEESAYAKDPVVRKLQEEMKGALADPKNAWSTFGDIAKMGGSIAPAMVDNQASQSALSSLYDTYRRGLTQGNPNRSFFGFLGGK